MEDPCNCVHKSLVTQTEGDYKTLGLDVGVYYGERKEFDKQHNLYLAKFKQHVKEN